MSEKEKPSKVAWITSSLALVGVIVAGLFGLLHKSGSAPAQTQQNSPGAAQVLQNHPDRSPVVAGASGDNVVSETKNPAMSGGAGNILAVLAGGGSPTNAFGTMIVNTGNGTVIIGGSDNSTNATIAAKSIAELERLERRVSGTETNIEVTREELRLLTKALKDLDERTSGMDLLPDGRTRYMGFIGGSFTRLNAEDLLVLSSMRSNNIPEAARHAEKMVELYEAGKAVEAQPNIILKVYLPDASAQLLYWRAASLLLLATPPITANSNTYKRVFTYATKAYTITNTADTAFLASGASVVLNDFTSATNYIAKAVSIAPKDETFSTAQSELLKAGPSGLKRLLNEF